MRTSEQRAFTLVELLLVLTVIGIVVAITMPTLIGSIHGNRLRMACREIVSAGRYARSMAVLKQCDMALVLDLDSGSISVVQQDSGGRVEESPKQEADTGTVAVVEQIEDQKQSVENQKATPAAREDLHRQLDRIKISVAGVEGEKSSVQESGRYTVIYRTNGRCEPYSVLLVDESGDSAVIEVDEVSSVRTETR